MTGKPVIRGTRIPVEMVVRMVAQGIAFKDMLADYPRLTRRRYPSRALVCCCDRRQ